VSGSMRERLALGLALFGVVLSGVGFSRLQSVHRARLAVESLEAGREAPEFAGTEAPLEVQLARAGLLARSGRNEDARELLVYLTERGASDFRRRAAYNLGNFYLRRALAKLEAEETDQAIPLVSLAKAAYRKALGEDPTDWDGKFNLELAVRMLPDVERAAAGNDDSEEEGGNRLWTTLPGFPRGQP
jgi:mxaK protein